MVKYNSHMGEGVDLCDMLLSMNRVPHRSTKYYMHIVFHCIGVCGKWVAPLSSSPTSEKSSTKEAHAPDQFSVSNSCKSLSGWKKHLQELHAHMVGDPPDSQLQLMCPSKKEIIICAKPSRGCHIGSIWSLPCL